MGLLRKLFWFAVFLGFTLCWVTVLEHGIDRFPTNLQKEFDFFKSAIQEKVERPKDTSDDPNKSR